MKVQMISIVISMKKRMGTTVTINIIQEMNMYYNIF